MKQITLEVEGKVFPLEEGTYLLLWDEHKIHPVAIRRLQEQASYNGITFIPLGVNDINATVRLVKVEQPATVKESA